MAQVPTPKPPHHTRLVTNSSSFPSHAPTFLPWLQDLAGEDIGENQKQKQRHKHKSRWKHLAPGPNASAVEQNASGSASSDLTSPTMPPSLVLSDLTSPTMLPSLVPSPSLHVAHESAARGDALACIPLLRYACTTTGNESMSTNASTSTSTGTQWGLKQCHSCPQLRWSWAKQKDGEGTMGFDPAADAGGLIGRSAMSADQLATWVSSLGLEASGYHKMRLMSAALPSAPHEAAVDERVGRYRAYAQAMREHGMGGAELEALTKVEMSARQLEEWIGEGTRQPSGTRSGPNPHFRSKLSEDWAIITRRFRQLPVGTRSALPHDHDHSGRNKLAVFGSAAAAAADANPWCCAKLESCVQLGEQLAAAPVLSTKQPRRGVLQDNWQSRYGHCSITQVPRGQECMRCAEGLHDGSFVDCPVARAISKPACYPRSCAETARHSCTILKNLYPKSKINFSMPSAGAMLPAAGMLDSADADGPRQHSTYSSSRCWDCVQELVRLRIWGWQCLRKDALRHCYPHPRPLFPLPDLPINWSLWSQVCAPQSIKRAIEQGCSALAGQGAVCERCVSEVGTTTRHVQVGLGLGFGERFRTSAVARTHRSPQCWELWMCHEWGGYAHAFCKWGKSGGRGW
jgi:hypothetical protein